MRYLLLLLLAALPCKGQLLTTVNSVGSVTSINPSFFFWDRITNVMENVQWFVLPTNSVDLFVQIGTHFDPNHPIPNTDTNYGMRMYVFGVSSNILTSAWINETYNPATTEMLSALLQSGSAYLRYEKFGPTLELLWAASTNGWASVYRNNLTMRALGLADTNVINGWATNNMNDYWQTYTP